MRRRRKTVWKNVYIKMRKTYFCWFMKDKTNSTVDCLHDHKNSTHNLC